MSNGKDLIDIAINFKDREAVPIKSDEDNVYFFQSTSVWKKMTEKSLCILLRKQAKQNRNFVPDTRQAALRDVIENLKAITYCENLIFDQFSNQPTIKDRYYINFRNSILKLEILRGFLILDQLPHTEDFFTVKQLSYDFDTAAGCIKFIKFIRSILNDDEIRFLQEWFGYLMIPTTRTHKMLVMRGLGGNGKSVIIRIIKLLLGEDALSFVPLSGFDSTQKFVLIKTDKKLINIVEEVDDKKSIASAVVKRFTAGNPVLVEDKYGDPRDMIPSARVMIATNQEILISDNSDGLKRRLIILPFTKQIQDKDKNTEFDTDEYWLSELSGIRNWAIRGLQRLVSNKWHFTESALMTKALTTFTNITDPHQKFLKDNIEFFPTGKLFGIEMYLEYKEYCYLRGIEPVIDSVFGRMVMRVFPHVIKTDNALTYKKKKLKTKSHLYYGIRFKEDSTPEEFEQSKLLAQQEQVY